MIKPTVVNVGARTDPAKQSINLDAYYISENRTSDAGPLIQGFYAVADADGSVGMGEAAARLVLTTLAQALEPLFGSDETSFLEPLRKAAMDADQRLKDLALKNEQWRDIQVSIACAVVADNRLYYLNTGKTSIYLLRDADLREFGSRKPVDGGELRPVFMGQPDFSCEVFEIKMKPGDSLLLATDGLVEKVRYRDIAEVLHWSISSQAACDRLISLAIRAEGSDNMTALVVDLLEEKARTNSWWKIALGIAMLLGVGFLLAFVLFLRHGPSATPTASGSSSSSSTPIQRYLFLDGLKDPYVVLLRDQDVYVLDRAEKRVRKYTRYAKEISGFDGTIQLAEAPCDMVLGRYSLIILDAAGKLFEMSPEGGKVTPIEVSMGDHGALSSPRAIDFDGTYFYVADRGNNRVVYFDANFTYAGEYSQEAGTTPLEKPNGLAINSKGDLYVCLKDLHKVLKLDANGQETASASTGATSVGTYDGPSDLALTYDEERVLVPEMSTDQILIFDASLVLQNKVGRDRLGDQRFQDPKSVTVSEEALFVAGGSSEDQQGYVWRIPWNLILNTP